MDISPPVDTPLELRASLLDAVLRGLVVLGLPAVAVSVYASLEVDLAWLAVADVVLYVVVLVLWWLPGLTYGVRSAGLLVAVGLLGNLVLLATGPAGAGFLWLTLLPVLAAVLRGRRTGVYAALSILATWAGMTALYELGWVAWGLDSAGLLLAVQAANAFVVGTLAAVSVGTLLRGLESHQAERTRMLKLLEAEQERLVAANEALEDEAAQRERVEAELVETSWRAGQAEIAREILHNMSNAVTSVVSQAQSVQERVRRVEPRKVGLAASLLRLHHDELGPYLTKDPRGKLLPMWLERSGEQLERDVGAVEDGVASLMERVEHLRGVLRTHQERTGQGDIECVRVTDLVEAAVRLALPLGHGSGWRVDVLVEPDLTLRVQANLVVQILVNLLINARNALRARQGVEGRIEVAAMLAPDGGARIVVTDNGVGVEREEATRIFERGYSTQGTTGIGLAMSRSAAERMGGRLAVQSDGRDQGATFVLSLPPAPPEDDRRPRAPARALPEG